MAAFVTHIEEKPKEFDFAANFICVHIDKEIGICGCRAAIEYSNSLY